MKWLGWLVLAATGFIVIAALSGPTPAPPQLNTAATLEDATAIIQAHGFSCANATEMRPGFVSGLKVTCTGFNGREYHYGVEDQGGRWKVEFRY